MKKGRKHKWCPQCSRYKNIKYFPVHRSTPDGLNGWCRVCTRIKKNMYHKIHRKNDNDRSRVNSKLYYQKIKDTKRKEYVKKNKFRIKKVQKEIYERTKDDVIRKQLERRNNSPKLLLRHNVSSLITQRLKKRASGKNGKSIIDFLPYTIDELMAHLESLFDTWMNWQNYGRKKGCWSIDHIIADFRFHYTSVLDKGFQECWALTNLRPFDHIENIKKGNRLINN